jgi:ABC-2 type transport system permease protein
VSLVVAHVRVQFVELVRIPAFMLPAIALPVLLFAIFGLQRADSEVAANHVVAGYCAFALIGVVLFDFGVNVAVDREVAWEKFLRTLPVSATKRLSARVMVALAIGVLSVLPIVVLAAVVTPIHISPGRAAVLAFLLVFGSIPFGLLGIAIGYTFSSKGASPVATLVYLPLAFVGGLWSPDDELPGPVRQVSDWTPTGSWFELLGWALGSGSSAIDHAVVLLGWTVLFGACAALGYRRDEGRQFR